VCVCVREREKESIDTSFIKVLKCTLKYNTLSLIYQRVNFDKFIHVNYFIKVYTLIY
jgi:hypothetical protein